MVRALFCLGLSLFALGCSSTHRDADDSGVSFDARPAVDGGDLDTGLDGMSPPPPPSMLCEPRPGDRPCQSCLKENCCEALTACQADENCQCVQRCTRMGGREARACLMSECGGPGPVASALRGCRLELCAEPCGSGGGGDMDGGTRPMRDGGTRPMRDGGTRPMRDGGTRPMRDGGTRPMRDGGMEP